MKNQASVQLTNKPDKEILYSPPEIQKIIRVSFYLQEPKEVVSKSLENKKRILLVVDSNLDESKIVLVVSLLKKHVNNVHLLRLDYGLKNLTRLRQIWNEMLRIHPDIAVALGGGTICDLVGFAASCYHRGLEHMFFPTTLLSMVDACIGGKTGIDFGNIKNSIGQIHYAVESHCIFPFLKTLKYEELISGFAEVIKAAMLFDNDLLESIEELPQRFVAERDWFSTVTRGAELKAYFSEQPFSRRSQLLYGHNLGHGLETLSTLHRRHGDCVSVGMNYELAMGVALNLVDYKVWARQNRILKKFDLPTALPKKVSFEKIKEKMRQYKLYKNGLYLFIIPKNPGEVIQNGSDYYQGLTENELDKAYTKAVEFIT